MAKLNWKLLKAFFKPDLKPGDPQPAVDLAKSQGFKKMARLNWKLLKGFFKPVLKSGDPQPAVDLEKSQGWKQLAGINWKLLKGFFKPVLKSGDHQPAVDLEKSQGFKKLARLNWKLLKNFSKPVLKSGDPQPAVDLDKSQGWKNLAKLNWNFLKGFFQTCVECKYICPETKSKLFHYQIMFNQSSQSSPLPKKILKEQNKMFLFLNLFFYKRTDLRQAQPGDSSDLDRTIVTGHDGLLAACLCAQRRRLRLAALQLSQ